MWLCLGSTLNTNSHTNVNYDRDPNCIAVCKSIIAVDFIHTILLLLAFHLFSGQYIGFSEVQTIKESTQHSSTCKKDCTWSCVYGLLPFHFAHIHNDIHRQELVQQSPPVLYLRSPFENEEAAKFTSWNPGSGCTITCKYENTSGDTITFDLLVPLQLSFFLSSLFIRTLEQLEVLHCI